jgi:5-methylcytosine-specific restriction endonuclease McrA
VCPGTTTRQGGHNDDLRITPAVPGDERAGTRDRRPTAAIARVVWQRDQGRCTYVDPRGQRCRETSMLEYHHEHPWALGGSTTVDNLSLRCRAHNTLAAEQDFGRALMQRKRSGDGGFMAKQ